MTIPQGEVLERYHVRVGSDRPWQRRLRLLQALWREEQGLPIGVPPRSHGDVRPLGSRLAMPDAARHLSNYLTPTIREVVHAELEPPASVGGGLVLSAPGVYDDLLSSRALSFNLFGELKADLATASVLGRHLWPDRVDRVTRIEFQHSPGPGDLRYLDDTTAFDVYLEHTVPGGHEGFIGIEVVYHESLQVAPARNHPRIEQVARTSGLFADESLAALREPPLQRIWHVHLLAQSMLQADAQRWAGNGLLVFLHPVANAASYRVIDAYQRRLHGHLSFRRATLEEMVAALQLTAGALWASAFHHRYLDYRRLDTLSAG